MDHNITISKSSFIKGKQCLKALYLSKHFPELRNDISPGQQAIFDTGHKVGELAQQLFPGGTLTVKDLYDNYAEGIERTRKLMADGCEIIYEAGFQFKNLSCFVDILVKEEEKWHIYEVKSSSRIKEVNFYDAAFQNMLLRKCGIDIGDVSIVYINTKYVRDGDIDLHELFAIESVFEKVKDLQPEVRNLISTEEKSLNRPDIPDVDIGPHCSDPYDCDFSEICWEDVPEYSVFNISRLKKKKKFDLYKQGIIKTIDVPENYHLNADQAMQVQADKSGKRIFNKKEIKRFLEGLQYPLYFLDFETFNPATPPFDDCSPYQQIVFQYSLHILNKPEGNLLHKEFLAHGDEDHRHALAQQLIHDIGTHGDIIVYSEGFESGRLKEIASKFPEYESQVQNILSRLVDLIVPFRKKHYYVAEMRGSNSIKDVLPALVPGFSYKGMEINSGRLASQAFEGLDDEKDEKVIAETRIKLLEYCKMDTLAMVEILKVLYLETKKM